MRCPSHPADHFSCRRRRAASLALGLLAAALPLAGQPAATAAPLAPPAAASEEPAASEVNVRRFGAVGDGHTDDTAAVRRAVAQGGAIRFPRGTYRLRETIEIDLQQVGYTSLVGHGVAQVMMEGPGPAFRFIGTHRGTAAPATVQPAVWERQRTPTVAGLEILGRHPQACGIEARGTMQLSIRGLVVREALHGVHLVDRNRNVLLSECHLYHNRGIGVFLDRLNLHQVNIANCHISYNAGGGVVARRSEIRNLQIGTCDIEGNMGDAEAAATANVWLDARQSSLGEVAIVGCTIQHDHAAADSANIRIHGRSTKRPFTDELRHGNITIADNVLSDVQTNVELTDVRAATITGNTIWKGYRHNVLVRGSRNIVLANNVLDRNPRYHYSDGEAARLGIVFEDSSDCTLNANHSSGVVRAEAAVVLRRCRRFNVTNCTILDYGAGGILLEEVTASRLSDCLILDERPAADGTAIIRRNVQACQIEDNLTDAPSR